MPTGRMSSARWRVASSSAGTDRTRAADCRRLKTAFEKAKRYTDFRVMLDKQKDIEAVSIATPDHLHAVIAYTAMKHGKHVYVQKPLTFSVLESRILAHTARDMKLVSQMGNQGHSMEGTRRILELINANVIGPVKEVHVWTDRPQRYWAQGIPRPAVQPVTSPAPTLVAAPSPGATPPSWNMGTVDRAVRAAMATNPQEIPKGLEWDLFIGPAPFVPYHPVYHPFSWRGWVDFGVSAIGDMGAHLIDQPFWALNLGLPSAITSSSTPWGAPASNPGSYPLAMMTRYEFGARNNMPPVVLTWYDGGLTPVIQRDFPLPGGDGGGGMFVGEKAIITYETYGNNPKVYREEQRRARRAVPKTVPRIEMSHEANWMNACMGKTQASSPFDYAAKLTETMLLGVVALRTGQANRIQVRRRADADHEQRRREQVADARISRRLAAMERQRSNRSHLGSCAGTSRYLANFEPPASDDEVRASALQLRAQAERREQAVEGK